MKELKKIKLNMISKAEMQDKEMSKLLGGCSNDCGCGCWYASSGGSSNFNNASANRNYGYHSLGGGCRYYLTTINYVVE